MARRKLAAFQFAQPGSYLLKFVQAAVAASAPSLSVTVGRDELVLSFPTQESELGNPSKVANALFNLPTERCPLRHLALGLNAASMHTPHEVLWQTAAGTVAVSQQDVRLSNESQDEPRLVLSKPRPVLSWFRGTMFLDELAQLSQACLYAPLELRVDGRVFERPAWSRWKEPVVDHLGLPYPFLLMELVRPAPRGLLASYPQGSYERQSDSLQLWNGRREESSAPADAGVPLLVQGWDGARGTLTASMVIGIGPSLRGGGRVLPVLDGVSLAPLQDLDLGHPGVQVLLDAADLAVDLSEFALVQDETLRGKLDGIRDAVQLARQELEPEPLRQALARSGVPAERMEHVQARAHWLLRSHDKGAPRTVEELTLSCFAGSRVLLDPDIPEKKLANARQVHGENLPPSERVLALFDDTVFGSAKQGFLVTENRLCWKGSLREAGFALWSELPYGQPCKQVPGGVEVLGCEVGVVTFSEEVAPLLLDLVQAVSRLALPALFPTSEAERSVLLQALTTLGKRPRFYYHPHLPAAWQARLPEIYPQQWTPEERALILYDDTLMGGADDGFVVTTDRLLWRNTFHDPDCLSWQDLAQETVSVSGMGVKVSDCEIFVHVKDLRQPVELFFKKMARL